MATGQSIGGPLVTIGFNLFDLKQQLEMAKRKEISWSQMARDAGLHRNTVERIASNTTDRVDLATIAKLLSYFHANGMEVAVGDLITVQMGGES